MLSRRTILKSIGLIGLSAAAGPLARRSAAFVQADVTIPPRWNGEPLGRICQAAQPARAEPNTESDVVTDLVRDDVVRVRQVVQGETAFANNDLWLDTSQGYLYASFVQPMWYPLPAPAHADLGEGRWAEVIVPYSDLMRTPDPYDPNAKKELATYGSVFRVDQLVEGTDGKSYYRVHELYQILYIRATHLRLIDDAELAPISPDVPAQNKTIDVNLTTQTLIAYEYGSPVFARYVSSGIRDHETPEGEHYVWDKRISERMVADTASDDPDFYNLPGVPFVCYFTDDWVGTHGTYWHNDFGRPRSHGCLNLPTEAARWVWRWTTPQGDLSEFYSRPRYATDGTKIVVHY